jgi:predicted nucleic acid-binding protein
LTRAYFDSSAIYKLSHAERETSALIDYLEQADLEVSTSVVAEVEVLRNLVHRGYDADGAMTGFFVIGLDDDIRRLAVDLGSNSLKSLDAIHVASALAIGDRRVEFITYDERQADAARQAGLAVVQPGR